MLALAVRDPIPADWTDWHRMWSANCAHFGAPMPSAHDHELWRRIIDPQHPVGALVCAASDPGGTLVGFAHYVLHPHTFSSKMDTSKTCGSSLLHAGPA
jgi:hypothetical protein